jgi:hypothetical protein
MYVLNGQVYEEYATTRVRYWAGETKLAATEPALAASRAALLGSQALLQKVHLAALYGNETLKMPGGMLRFPWYFDSYFSKGCKRRDRRCVKEDDPFYTTVHNGLDAMLQYYLECAESVGDAREPPRNNTASNVSRLRYILEVGGEDILSAQQEFSQTIRDNQTDIQKSLALQAVVLALMFVGCTWWWVNVVRPLAKSVAAEATSCARFLSELPQNIDVDALVLDVFAGAGAAAALNDSAKTEEDEERRRRKEERRRRRHARKKRKSKGKGGKKGGKGRRGSSDDEDSSSSSDSSASSDDSDSSSDSEPDMKTPRSRGGSARKVAPAPASASSARKRPSSGASRSGDRPSSSSSSKRDGRSEGRSGRRARLDTLDEEE